jgi:tetratricopeptide (TPR) repeat protein
MFHYDKGNTLYHLEKFEEATKEYELASNLDPKNLEYCNAKGNALKRSGRFPEALREIENGLAQAQGRSPRLLIAYAEVMACMDMTTAALNKLSSAIAPGGGIDWHDLAEVAKPELKSGTLSEKEKAMLNAFLELEPISSQTTSTETSGRIQRPRGITILVGIQIAGSLLASAVAEAVAADLHASVYPIVVPFVILPSIFALALFSGRSWARTLMLIGAVLDFESFFGIVWGVAFLWYLTRPRVTAYFKQPRS